MLGQSLSSRKVALLPELDLISSPLVLVGRPYLLRDEMILSALYWDSVEVPADMPGLTESDDRVLEELVGEAQLIKTWASKEAYESNNERPFLNRMTPEIRSLEQRLSGGGADYQHLAAWAEELVDRMPSDGSLSLLSKSLPRTGSHVEGRRAIAARLLGALGVPTEASVREVLDFKGARRNELNALHVYLGDVINSISSDDPEHDVRIAQNRLITAVSDYHMVMSEAFRDRVNWSVLIGGAIISSFEMALDVGIEAAIATLVAGGAVSLFRTNLSPKLPAGHHLHPVTYAYGVSATLA